MKVIGIREEEYRLFKSGHLFVHFMGLEVGFEMGKIIDRSLSMCRRNNVLWVLPDFTGNFVPGSFDSCDGVGKSAVL